MIRGHLKQLTLGALSKQACTGYTLMQRLEAGLGSKPSPGSIYPLLSDLEKERIIQVEKRGRKKVYHLTKKGRSEASSLKQLRQQFIKQMHEAVKLCGILTGEDMAFQEYIIESFSRGELPFKEISSELRDFRSQMARLAQSNKLSRNREKLRAIIQNTNKRLAKIP